LTTLTVHDQGDRDSRRLGQSRVRPRPAQRVPGVPAATLHRAAPASSASLESALTGGRHRIDREDRARRTRIPEHDGDGLSPTAGEVRRRIGAGRCYKET
jgi:hypothetical protein